jgi:hypothetical protein
MNLNRKLTVILLVVTGLVGVTFTNGGEPVRGPVIDAKTEVVINGALRYLASQQRPNGSWVQGGGKPDFEVAMTGYVLLTFLSTGNLPDNGPFAKNVRMGQDFLLEAVGPDGLFTSGGKASYMYGHGIATIALAELYGQTRAAAIRPKLERLVKVIIGAQSAKDKFKGGWRYNPQPKDADISVTVLQMVALRAAKNAGLDVSQEVLDAAVSFVRRCYDEKSGGFCYQPGAGPGMARTAAAIYSLQVCGQYDDPMVQAGSKYLFENQGSKGTWFTYGHFYAAPAQYMIGGETWNKWYGWIHDLLLEKVTREGDKASWELFAEGGPYTKLYTTAVYTYILAMPYQYLPLYQR